MSRDTLKKLGQEITACRACPRLVRWREKVAVEKRAAYRDEEYWGRAVTGFGDPKARLFVLGLAPAAHGANRTGRVFTGDESGRWLYRALHRAGFANQAESTHRKDGLKLIDAWVGATLRCAPPANKPEPIEERRCQPFLDREIGLLKRLEIVVCLGGIAHKAFLAWLLRQGYELPRPRPKFGHGSIFRPGAGLPVVLDSFHPSQQNTFTKRLTEPMFDDLFRSARRLLGE